MSVIFMISGLVFGVVVFGAFVWAIIVHFTYESPQDEQKRLWLASLSKRDRAKYERHERRKKEYLRLMNRRTKICLRIRRMWYYQRKPDNWIDAWVLAGKECGGEEVFNAYKDVWSADDCPVGIFDGATDLLDVAPIDPPKAPQGVWDPTTEKVVK
jgi:hypothetical protein